MADKPITAAGLDALLTERFAAAGGRPMSEPISVTRVFGPEWGKPNWDVIVSMNRSEVTIWEKVLRQAQLEHPEVDFG